MVAYWVGTRMCVVGLTGGIACGKSTVSEYLKEHGFSIVDCDKINHELYENDNTLLRQIKRHFPSVGDAKG